MASNLSLDSRGPSRERFARKSRDRSVPKSERDWGNVSREETLLEIISREFFKNKSTHCRWGPVSKCRSLRAWSSSGLETWDDRELEDSYSVSRRSGTLSCGQIGSVLTYTSWWVLRRAAAARPRSSQRQTRVLGIPLLPESVSETSLEARACAREFSNAPSRGSSELHRS